MIFTAERGIVVAPLARDIVTAVWRGVVQLIRDGVITPAWLDEST